MEKHLSDFANRPFALVGHYVGRRRWSHVAIVAAIGAAVTCSVGSQYGVKFLVDSLSASPRAVAGVWIAFGILVALIACDNLLWRLAGMISIPAFVGVTGDIRASLFRHLTGHSSAFFIERMPGTLTSRITATANSIFIVESMVAWNVLPPCVATTGAIVLLATVSAAMTGALAAVAAVMIVILFRAAAAGRPLHHGYAERAAEVDGEIADIVGNLPLVRAFNGYRREYRRVESVIGAEMIARRRSLFYLERIRLSHAISIAILTIGLLAWAILLWQRNEATAGDVVLVCTLGFTVLHSTRDLAVALVDATQHFARLSEALATLLVPHMIDDDANARPLRVREGAITFERATFRYPDRHLVFRGLDLHIKGGQRVGLVGPSGCGKSTLFNLMQRFYELQLGQILIDGQDIAAVTQESLGAAIAVVPQDVSLFHRSIMENIRYGRPNATDEEVLEAAAAARCRDFIEAMPEGFRSIVGDRGAKMSGGQRQRIAIARALLKDAPILLLDEATSALDAESEAEVRGAIDHLIQGRTVIAVAHRLSTLRDFDRIVVLDGGRIVQDGPPDQLSRQSGPYRDQVDLEMNRFRVRPVRTVA